MLSQYRAALIRRRLSPNTIRLRIFYLRKFRGYLGASLLTATLEDFESYLDSHPEWTLATRQTVIATIRSYYQWAKTQGHIAVDPSVDLLNIRVHRKPSRIATEAALIAALNKGSAAERAMIRLAAECGLRLHEIAALHRDDRTGEWLTLVGKGNVQRTVWVSPELAADLDEIETQAMRHGFYFPGRSTGHLHETTVWRHISNLTGFNPHALRHRAGTTVYRQTGKDLRVTQEFLGHARPETTAIYVHVERDDLRRAGQAARIAA